MQPTTEQEAIIASDAKDLLVIAGPGTGKTTTIAAAIRHRARSADMSRAVVITYTAAAAKHLAEKIGASARPRFIGTLHAWALFELNQCFAKKWAIVDDADADEMLRKAADALNSKEPLSTLRAAIFHDKIGSSASIVAQAYRRAMIGSNTLDFDLILWLFRDSLRANMIPTPSLLVVDEFQDTAPIDAEIYDLATGPNTRRLRVGDPDQCIYSFRGASLANIMDAARPPTALAFLTANWRSNALICAAASRLIAHNKNRIAKDNRAAVEHLHKGSIATVEPFADELLEAAAVAEMAKRCAAQGHTVAVLVRTNAALDIMRLALPGHHADNRPPIERAILASAINALVDPTNATAAATWLRHYTAAQGARFEALAGAAGKSVLAYALGLVNAQRTSATIAKLRAMKVPPAAIAWALQNNIRLVLSAELVQADLVAVMRADTTEQDQPITLATFHGAKGREFDHVIIAAAEAEATPGQKRGDELEEERRLFYVAATRARRTITITSAKQRRNPFTKSTEPRTPTRFIQELTA